MRFNLSSCVLLVLLFSASLGLLGQTAASPKSEPSEKAKKVMSFEVEIIAVDSNGEFYNISNFAQSLDVGQEWGATLSSSVGDLLVQITWSKNEDPPVPSIQLTLTDAHSEEPHAKGKAKLEKLVWDYLYGPEPFTTTSDKAFILKGYGRPVAVASVTLEN